MPPRFQPGDLVRISKNLSLAARYLHADAEAIVEYSYAGKYGGNEHNSYSLYIRGIGKSSWYEADHLTYIDSGRFELLEKWTIEVKNHSSRTKPG